MTARPQLLIEHGSLPDEHGSPHSAQGAASPDAGADRARRVAEAAYYRAQQRGFAPGFELDDWIAAEREIDALAEAAT